jgi:hypothetical protein
LASSPYESTVGRFFECQDDPPLPLTKCPSWTQLGSGPVLNPDTGEWSCPLCYALVGRDNEEDEELFDDDEEAAFDNDEDYTAEGERIQDQTDEERIRVTRYRAIDAIIDTLGGINPKFSRYLSEQQYNIVDQLRVLEEAKETLFEAGTGRGVKPKLIALTIFMSGLSLSSQELRLLGIRPSAIESRLKVLRALSNNDSEQSPMVEKMYFIGKSVGLSKPIIDIMVEQYEEVGMLPNIEPNWTVRAAAWIFLAAKQSGIKGVSKAKLVSSNSQIKKNALDRAVTSYRVNLQNRIKPVEGVLLSDDD